MAKCRHCGGTGQEPEYDYTPAQEDQLAALAELGNHLAAVSTARTLAGAQAREDVYGKIRRAIPEAQATGLPKAAIAEALGVSRAQLYNILKRDAA